MTMESVLERLHRGSVGGIGVQLTKIQEYLWLCHGNSWGIQKGELNICRWKQVPETTN
jgi:hypothetical protein